MLFNSLSFALFFPILFLLYWAIPAKFRYLVLLGASYLFYLGFGVRILLLLVVVSAMTYIAGLLVEPGGIGESGEPLKFVKNDSARVRRVVLFLSATGVTLLLAGFKYGTVIWKVLGEWSSKLGSYSISVYPAGAVEKIIIPAGLSFYTFKALSYVVDVYRGKYRAERNPAYLALYVAFFADIISGPINRGDVLLPQFRNPQPFDERKAVYGLRLMLLGFIKKLLLADMLAVYVNKVFGQVEAYAGLTLLAVAFMYTVEIYCDFSGYSDIAIGIAALLGITSMENFKGPYFARNVKEFWDRWHISLSSWLRDYIYFPLGGSRRKTIRTYGNLMITFLISGLWHGASLTFFIWGAIHGLYQVLYRIGKSLNKKEKDLLPAWAGRILTFLLVGFAWIFFRAESLRDAGYVICHMFDSFSLYWVKRDLGITRLDLVVILLLLLLLAVYDWFSREHDLIKKMDQICRPLRWGIYLVAVVGLVVLKLHGGTSQSFIYFNF